MAKGHDNITHEIREILRQRSDPDYRDFQAKLIPNVDPSGMIGVRTPELRALARELSKREDIGRFLADTPHRFFDEDQLHAFIISLTKDFETCLAQVEAFLPFIGNWATCDQLSPKVFSKHRGELLSSVRKWTASEDTYTVRFGIGMLMSHYLDECFDPVFPELVAGIRSEEYYINMMRAWYFATALAKRRDDVIGYIEDESLDRWTHNMAIRKALESRRVCDADKAYLRTLKR